MLDELQEIRTLFFKSIFLINMGERYHETL